jgi:SLA1 homology domain 1, SHD1
MITIPKFVLSLSLVGLLASSLCADELLVAPVEGPQYELGSIQLENDRFGMTVLVIDYKLVKNATQPTGNISIAGKTKGGELIGFGIPTGQQSGQLRIGLRGMLMTEHDFEVFLVMSGAWQKKYMVSNAVRLGDPGPATVARQWTEEETKAADQARLFRTPPAELPEGFLPVTAETNLIPGMPVKAGSYGKWEDAEVVSFEVIGPVTLKYPSQDVLQTHPREKWLAVDPAILAKAKSDPSQFKLSVRVLPDSRLIIPAGAIPLADDVELPPGTPLILDGDYQWKNIFVVEAEDDEIRVRYEGYEADWDEKKPRDKFLIEEKTLALLSQPDKVKKFAKNLVSSRAKQEAEWEARQKSHEEEAAARSKQIRDKVAEAQSRIQRQMYAIDIPIPKRAQIVPADLELEEGTSLAVCWGLKWQPLTVLRENQDGSVHVRWDERSSAFDSDIAREQLIIENKTVRKLRRKPAAATDDLKTVLRTWTDVTGKHKIEATLVSKTDSEVTLRTDAGREITLPLEKLSEEDRALLSGEQLADDDNPFK